jgi:polysaccharide export outer membrane protein
MLLAGLLLTGCQSESNHFADVPGMPGPAEVGGGSGSTTNSIDPTLDFFHANDAVQVTFKDIPVPIEQILDQVKADGTITLIQNQSFNVEGKTRAQIEQEIRERYVPAYFKNLTVSFQHQPQSRFYYVGGEVKAPGRQVYIGMLTVRGAIQSAGDFTDFANKRSVELKRSNGSVLKVNCVKARQDPRLDLPVYPNDIIYVPRRPI